MPSAPTPTPPPADTRTAENKIDLAIVRSALPRVVIDLAAHAIDPAEVTPALLDRYRTAQWRIVDLTDGTLTLSN